MKGTPKFSPLPKSAVARPSQSTLDSVFSMLDDIDVRKERAAMNRLLDQIGQNRAKWTGFQEMEYEISRRLQELPSGPAQPERTTHRVRVPNWPKYTPLPAPERIPQLPPPERSPRRSPTPKSVAKKVPSPWKRPGPWAVKRIAEKVNAKSPRLTRLHPRDIVLDVAMELAREIAREVDPEFVEGVDEVTDWFTSGSDPYTGNLTITDAGGHYVLQGAGYFRNDQQSGYTAESPGGFYSLTFKEFHPKENTGHEWHAHNPEFRPHPTFTNQGWWEGRYVFRLDPSGKPEFHPDFVTKKTLPVLKAVPRRSAPGFSPDNAWKPGGFSIVLPPNGPPYIEKGVPKGRKRKERKHRGHAVAMGLLSNALDLSTELTEYWMILRDLAGVPDSMTEREFFMYLYNGGIWEIDGNQLAIDFAANILEDVFYGRAFGAVQKAMKRAGQSTYTLGSAPSVF